jgi:hypothetical protein
MKTGVTKALANHEIVTLAVYLLGGDAQRMDTEDVAIKANELAPRRFTWRKYPQQINIENVRTFLSDAKKPKNGAYLIGAGKDGWILTEAGLAFAKQHVTDLRGVDLSRKALSAKERNWMRRERERMLSSDACLKFGTGKADAITTQEAEAFFRIDTYVTGRAREEKIMRAKNAFGDDEELGPVIRALEPKVNAGGSK